MRAPLGHPRPSFAFGTASPRRFCGIRCLLFASLFIGSHMIAADHGTRSRAEVTDQALKRLLA
jgi:hypothetical protein